jgi:hypothetical protein
MERSEQTRLGSGRLDLWITVAATAIATLLLVAAPAEAQTYTVLHNFTRGTDGAYPLAAVTRDGSGNLYGTASAGGNTGGHCGNDGCGTVFKLTQHTSGWIFAPLYSFAGIDHDDGASPDAPVTVGPDGALYGTTNAGGSGGAEFVNSTTPGSGAVELGSPFCLLYSKINIAAAMTVVHRARLSPTALCVMFAVRTILFDSR